MAGLQPTAIISPNGIVICARYLASVRISNSHAYAPSLTLRMTSWLMSNFLQRLTTHSMKTGNGQERCAGGLAPSGYKINRFVGGNVWPRRVYPQQFFLSTQI